MSGRLKRDRVEDGGISAVSNLAVEKECGTAIVTFVNEGAGEQFPVRDTRGALPPGVE